MTKQPPTEGWLSRIEPILIACGYGFAAGAVAAAVLKLMKVVEHVVWSGSDARWYGFLVVLAGGLLIALLRSRIAGQDTDLEHQLQAVADGAQTQQRLIFYLACIAIVSVAFGGAVGPEAGILAVVSEMTALVSMAIGRSQSKRKLIGEAAAAGALGGLYGSPPGGAAITTRGEKSPTPLLFLAALAGLLGFLLAARLLLEGGGIRIKLADYVAPLDGSDIIEAIAPAILGGVAGLAFTLLLPRIRSLLERTSSQFAQIMVGTLAFAALTVALPVLRFSGHHSMEAMLAWGESAGVASLIALALLKSLALAICLAAGWLGGAAFPLLFAGAAAGSGALALFPATDPTLALIAGMAAAITAGMGKPAAAALIVAFLVSPFAVGPLCMGVLVGYGFSRIGPPPHLH